ncbi:16480_t:CDS:2 [Dentiscutata erythropus]|uniref:16480_t:CDS:1 n=1 Tax=Dentiscutata erythropus TaxID=1348616 RepID=A0A9N9BJM2_9GLOM|nr:16480_t:CDS:2 [Dentiscutata erythropus]
MLPILAITFVLGIIDLDNIGNADVAGYNYIYFNTTPYNYIFAVSAHFIGFIIFEIPSNLVTDILGLHVWLPILMICWSITSMTQAACTTVVQLGFVRFLIAAYPPSIVAYIGSFYSKNELTLRYSVIGSLIAIGGALSGSNIWYFIDRFSMVIYNESIPTLIMALIIVVFLTRGPGNARLFTPEERNFAIERLKYEGGNIEIDSDLAKAQVKFALTDILTYIYTVVLLITAIPFFALNFYLPTLVNQLGYNDFQAQLMVVPPLVISTIFMLLNSWSGQYKRNTMTAIILTANQIGGIIGLSIFPATDAPSFIMGSSICLAVVILSSISVIALKFYLELLNKKRDLTILANHNYKLNDNDLKDNKRIREIAMKLVENEPKYDEVLCDKHLNWRYIT